jgi:hypothetical protein
MVSDEDDCARQARGGWKREDAGLKQLELSHVMKGKVRDT